MINMTTGQIKLLQELQDFFDYSANSEVRKKWRLKYDENLKFYYGDQWSEALKKELEDVGAMPFVVNRIEPIVTTYTSLQISARRRIAFKANTGSNKDAQIAEYLNNLVYSIQSQNDFQNKSTQKYTDALIGGLGWTHFGYEPNSDQTFFYDYIDPREVYFDPDDHSLRLEESNFVCRSYFVSGTKLKERYSEFSQYFNQIIDQNTTNDNYSLYENYNNDDTNQTWVVGRSARIVEVYYKKNATYYEAIVQTTDSNVDNDINNDIITEKYFVTFDENLANEKKVKGSSVKKLTGTQIWKGVFCQDLLLESGPISCQVPNQKHFPLVPLCLKRNYQGVPYGIVDGLIPLSTSLNYVWTKTMHGLNTKYLIIDQDNIDIEKMRPKLRAELSRRDGIIFSKNPHQTQLINSETMLPHLEKTLQRIDVEFQQRTQLFDELKGEQTNAISGIAIQARATNSARSQNPLHATYEHMLFSEGKLILDTIKGIKDFRYAINYYKDNKINYGVITNDVSMINFEIITDTAPNYTSSNEEETARFEALLNSPNSSLVLSDPFFLKKLGFTESDAKTLSAIYLKIISGNQQNQQNQQNQ